MKPIDFSNVQTPQNEHKRLGPGGYVIGITRVEDHPDKEYLLIEYDIAEGEFKNYYYDLNQNMGFWGGSFIKSYKDKALGFFKQFIDAVTASNRGYKWDNDERKLTRKLVGAVLQVEAYTNRFGEPKEKLAVVQLLPADEIRKGNFTVPEPKGLTQKPAEQPAPSAPAVVSDPDVISDEGVPF